MKNKVKIGEVEFTMPFKAEGVYVLDADDEIFIEVSRHDRDWDQDYEIAEIATKAFNEYFAKREIQDEN